MRLLFVHGRAQGGKDPNALKQVWLKSLEEGLAIAGTSLPTGVTVDFPFYGDVLDAEVERLAAPNRNEVSAMGSGENDAYSRFMVSVLTEVQKNASLSDAEIRSEMDSDVGAMGPENWEWVQAIVKVLDKRFPGLTSLTFEVFLRDVFLYLTSRTMRRKINKIIEAELTNEPTVVVSHSLGTVVCYDILKDRNFQNVKGLITLGSPLGIKGVSGHLGLLRHVSPKREWLNAYDERDIVALNPLDEEYFPVNPRISNNNRLKNKTDNRHGIVGYLDDPSIARKIVEMMS